MLHAVIFDMDGLLIDSEPFWRAAHVAALGALGITIDEDEVRLVAGRRTDEIAALWVERFGLVGTAPLDLEARITDQVVELVRSEGRELPGASALVSALAERRIPMAVASSAAPTVIAAVLDRLGLAAAMTVVHSARDEPFGKPHPGVFLTTAARLGVEVTGCVVLEDSVSGVRAAVAAGMRCIAVPEASERDRVEFGEADSVVNSLREVTVDALIELADAGRR